MAVPDPSGEGALSAEAASLSALFPDLPLETINSVLAKYFGAEMNFPLLLLSYSDRSLLPRRCRGCGRCDYATLSRTTGSDEIQACSFA